MRVEWISILVLVFSGVLAGAEFMVRYGVQPALSALVDVPHIQARQALIARLRVLVPAVMLPTIALSVAALVFGGSGGGLPFRWAATLSLIAFALISFLGTVPINMQVNDWDAHSPPEGWQRTIARWAFIDVFRSSFALLAFACYALAVAY